VHPTPVGRLPAARVASAQVCPEARQVLGRRVRPVGPIGTEDATGVRMASASQRHREPTAHGHRTVQQIWPTGLGERHGRPIFGRPLQVRAAWTPGATRRSCGVATYPVTGTTRRRRARHRDARRRTRPLDRAKPQDIIPPRPAPRLITTRVPHQGLVDNTSPEPGDARSGGSNGPDQPNPDNNRPYCTRDPPAAIAGQRLGRPPYTRRGGQDPVGNENTAPGLRGGRKITLCPDTTAGGDDHETARRARNLVPVEFP
jgi:hypothetical protein